MKILIKPILFFFLFIEVSYADLIKPNSELKPFDVLSIQLNSLKNNNFPYKDAGIEQAWEFAHPNNKKITGPLKKFKQMIYSESYKILIKHENNKIEILRETNAESIYKVFILSNNKKKYYYIWKIEKILFEGNLKNCWMTTSVSQPMYLGEVI
tara:strand:+ start:503 stop:964 length:462 start_codon:yes stop_codon:yes gene_type:complete